MGAADAFPSAVRNHNHQTCSHQSREYCTKKTIDTVFSLGLENPYSRFFTGKTYLNMLSVNDDVFHAPIGSVTFEPGARTHWHKHSGGQILLVTAGEGRYQERGKKAPDLNVLKGCRYKIFGKAAMRYNPTKKRIDLMSV